MSDSTEESVNDMSDTNNELVDTVNGEDLTNARALIGTVEGSKHEICWEFGNPKLGNRHLLIQGKSGQGKGKASGLCI